MFFSLWVLKRTTMEVDCDCKRNLIMCSLFNNAQHGLCLQEAINSEIIVIENLRGGISSVQCLMLMCVQKLKTWNRFGRRGRKRQTKLLSWRANLQGVKNRVEMEKEAEGSSKACSSTPVYSVNWQSFGTTEDVYFHRITLNEDNRINFVYPFNINQCQNYQLFLCWIK